MLQGMATDAEIRRLEAELAAAKARLDAARAGASPYAWSSGDAVMRGWRDRDSSPSQRATADARWNEMVAEAERMCAAGKSVSPEFILGAAERARRDQGDDGSPKVVKLRSSFTLPPAELAAWSRGKPK
jgi:hypothetical protein